MKRRLIGVAAVLLVGMGALLGKYGMPGLGSGDGGFGTANDSQTTASVSPDRTEAPPAETPSEKTLLAVEQGAVVVRVQDQSFLVRGSSGSMTAATIEEIVEQAKATEPNSSGIRVCIRREASAKAGAWGKLVEQLKSAGVADDQIDWGNDQVP